MTRPQAPFWLWLSALGASALVLAFAGSALAVDEPVPFRNCTCHNSDGSNCERCHEFPMDYQSTPNDGLGIAYWKTSPFWSTGPHGLYSATTDRCSMCHTLHDAPTGYKLLPGETVKATCFTCHDGTGGQGVYGAIKARTGLDAAGGHMVESTAVVPGGDATNGGSATVAFRGPSGNLTCSDCHSPHDSNTVDPFTGERIRIWDASQTQEPQYSSRLLKKRPTGATADVGVYGSDWCMSCHKGRGSASEVHNHPVDSLQVRADAYSYEHIPAYYTWSQDPYWNGVLINANGFQLSSLGGIFVGAEAHNTPDPPTANTAMYEGSGWLMAYPRNALQAGHGPICQQCHEDSREVGELRNNGTEVWMQPDRIRARIADGYIDGTTVANPRFQNFPHETENVSLLIETGDDLCLNCHPTAQLP